MFEKLLKRAKENNAAVTDTASGNVSKAEAARKRCIETVVRNTGWSHDEAASRIDSARSRLGVKYTEYRKCRMWELSEEEQERAHLEYVEAKAKEKEEKQTDAEAAEERKRLLSAPEAAWNEDTGESLSYMERAEKIFEAVSSGPVPGLQDMDFDRLKDIIGERYIPGLSINRYDYEQFQKRYLSHRDIDPDTRDMLIRYTDWLFFCRDDGYDMDDYFDYEFWDKDEQTRKSFISANFRDNLTRLLNRKSIILAKKSRFLSTFNEFVKRDWIDFDECSEDDFREFIKSHPVFIAKLRISSGGAGISKMDVTGMSEHELEELFAEFRQKGGVAEAVIEQHPDMSAVSADTVNTVRVLTIVDASDKAVVTGAAARFGRSGAYTDNYHQGGVVALIDTSRGCIKGDAIDRSGAHYPAHPDSGIRFDGYQIPFWDRIVSLLTDAAESCKDVNRLIGWDVAIDKEGDIEIIEGNSIPGFDILQAPDMTGRRKEYEEHVTGLFDLKELDNKTIGYWRKKII